MKHSLPILALVFMTIFVQAQMQVDKPLQMTGASAAERRIINVGPPTTNTDAATAGNIQSGNLVYADGSLSGSVYAVTLSPTPAAYTAGMMVNFKANLTNTSPVSINVNGLSNKLIKKNVSTDLAVGDIAAGQLVSVIYDGTNFQMLAGALIKGSDNYIQAQTTADQGVGFRVSGSSYFTGNANVGIGTSGPQGKLHIHNALIDEKVVISGAGFDGSTYSRFSLYVDTNYGMLFEAPAIGNVIANRSNYSFAWRGGPAALFIKGSTGAVGIGTTNPNSNAKLDVNGFVRANNGFLIGGANTGMRIEYGTITVTTTGDKAVSFTTAFTTAPVVTFGTSYTSGLETFATMTSPPSTTGFGVRLVDANAGWAFGKVYWMAIGN